ncbi:MAG: YfhO family protein [bacterium]|nr:YfhO family protein [bacterium]
MASPGQSLRVPPVAAAALLYAVVFSVVFGEILAGHKTVIHGDALSVALPFQQLFVDSLAEGSLPLWSRLTYGGHPVFAEGQGAFAHPLTWLVFGPLALFSRAGDSTDSISAGLLYAHGAFHFVCAWIAALGTFGVARALGLGLVPALFAGLALAASQGWLLLTMNATIAGATAWVPLFLLCVVRWSQQPDVRRGLAMGAAAALLILAGYPQALHAAALFALALFLLRIDRRVWRSPGAHLATGLLAVGIAVALSAVQWLPTAELAAQSVRAGGTKLNYSHTFAEQLRGIVASIGGRNPLLPGLGSALAFGLALFGLRRSRTPLALALATVFLYQLGMGEHSPVFRALHPVLPGLDRFRIAWMYSTVGLVGLCLLAGFGVEAMGRLARSNRADSLRLATAASAVALALWWVHTDATPIWNVAFAAAGLVAAASLVATGRADRIAPLLVGLLVLEVFVTRIPLQRFGDFDAFRSPPATAGFLRERERGSRGYKLANLPHTHTAVAFAAPDRENIERLAQRLLHSLGGGSSQLWSLPSITGNLALPLARRSGAQALIEAETRGEHPNAPGHRLIDAMALRYLVFDRGDKNEPHARDFVKVFDEPAYRFSIRENPSARPLMRLVAASNTQWVADWQEALAVFDASRATGLVLEGTPARGFETDEDRGPSLRHRSIGQIAIGRSSFRVEVRVETPSYLVIADAPYPGWVARVDGREAPVHPANLLGKAVALEPGAHTVELHFESRSVQIGAAISGIALLAAAGIAWRG